MCSSENSFQNPPKRTWSAFCVSGPPPQQTQIAVGRCTISVGDSKALTLPQVRQGATFVSRRRPVWPSVPQSTFSWLSLRKSTSACHVEPIATKWQLNVARLVVCEQTAITSTSLRSIGDDSRLGFTPPTPITRRVACWCESSPLVRQCKPCYAPAVQYSISALTPLALAGDKQSAPSAKNAANLRGLLAFV